jgi:hypothetical protein
MRIEPKERTKEEVVIVDLSGPSPKPRAIRERELHRKVLSFIKERGEASKPELSAHFPRVRYEDLLRTVEDLSLMGKVEIHWSSPFYFTVRASEEESPPSSSSRLLLA